MPKPIKIALSLLVQAIAFGAWFFGDSINLGVGLGFLLPFALFLVFALWIFPEPTKKKLQSS